MYVFTGCGLYLIFLLLVGQLAGGFVARQTVDFPEHFYGVFNEMLFKVYPSERKIFAPHYMLLQPVIERYILLI